MSEFMCFEYACYVILHTSVTLIFRYDKHNYIDETQATLHLTSGSEEVLYLVIIQTYVQQKHLKQNFVSLINTNT
jgi:hypothetical protein